MQIFDSPDNPCPPGAEVFVLQTRDVINLRAAYWPAKGDARGTLVLAQGRSEFIEKYLEIIHDFMESGLNVITFDWRGQGLSDRLLKNRRKGHIDEMASYLEDLAAVEIWLKERKCTRPWFALGHSMGGALLLLRAHTAPTPFARMVLSAPMIDLAGLKYPRAARMLASGLDLVGLGSSFVPGGTATAYFTQPFAGNVLTSDPKRYAKFTALAAQAPDIWVGSPTVHWLVSAFGLMQKFASPDYAMDIEVPILILAAGHDRVVDTTATARFAQYLKNGHLVTIIGAEHELMIERDELRAQFMAAFAAYIPGAESGSDAAALDAGQPVR